jgi:mycofactocin precursor
LPAPIGSPDDPTGRPEKRPVLRGAVGFGRDELQLAFALVGATRRGSTMTKVDDARIEDELDEDELDEDDEVLVEEISIDGMCGVY